VALLFFFNDMSSILILNAQVINEGKIQQLDVFVKDGIIEKVGFDLQYLQANQVIDAAGKYLMPGVIDDQVHFREPGLTHKATIYTEAKAAVAVKPTLCKVSDLILSYKIHVITFVEKT
jgi:dihydroorotase